MLWQKFLISPAALPISARRPTRPAAGYTGGTEGRRRPDRDPGRSGDLLGVCPLHLCAGDEGVHRPGEPAEPCGVRLTPIGTTPGAIADQ